MKSFGEYEIIRMLNYLEKAIFKFEIEDAEDNTLKWH